MKRLAILGMLCAGTAYADPPTFVSLDRTANATSFGAHLGIMFFEDSDSDGGRPSLKQPRLQLFGEYAVTPNFGAMMSTSVIRFSNGPVGKTGLGATHVGGYARYETDGFEAVARVSLILPTTSFIPRDSYYEDVAIHGTLFPWLEERAIDADAFWLHGGATLRYRKGKLSAQLDGFVDVPLSGKVYKSDMSRGTPFRLHIGAGVAYAPSEPWRFGLEVLGSGYPKATQLYGDLEADEITFVSMTGSVTRIVGPGREVMFWFANPLNAYLRSYWHAAGVGYQSLL